MSREFGPKTCDWCFTVIEGRSGDYCSEDCKDAHERDLGISDDDDDKEECFVCGKKTITYHNDHSTCESCGSEVSYE
jgi:hypothetical protein